MASTRTIKRKIKSVTSTRQITKAMNLVAASKLQRSKQRLEEFRAYAAEMNSAVARIAAQAPNSELLHTREIKKLTLVVFTGDRGLCGGYNMNVCKAAQQLINDNPEAEASIIMIGGKGRDYFQRRRQDMRSVFTGISEKPLFSDATDLGRLVTDLFTRREADAVYLVYTRFKSSISQEPTALRILPAVAPEASEGGDGPGTLTTYEPDAGTILEYLIPRYVNTEIYNALVESAVCEQAARRTSMDTASDNASGMIDKYIMQFNRARQAAITQELTEIVNGANALN